MASSKKRYGTKINADEAIVGNELASLADEVGKGPKAIGSSEKNWDAASFGELLLLQFGIDIGRSKPKKRKRD